MRAKKVKAIRDAKGKLWKPGRKLGGVNRRMRITQERLDQDRENQTDSDV